ncbi:twin-arginine translocase subunit TatC [Candidatus Synchoanobacter obligatus]|uniref:Sec-independent protein translocase protein TatC n=1 Tax=Candidatus Synchoanobacter obligatus TaxID=2919597 RepID=A0ABT1L4M4_9GAMM|nr:twin-arginine translocase subunit TatC [Candidatus Synchoanobacter obligatus]MCP8352106.1 twin-arginine translocase subunit TatC [Candidatus Synchoanobacter obligatus]
MIEYWFELRRRLLWCGVAYISSFFVFFSLHEKILYWLSQSAALKDGRLLMSIHIVDPIVIPMQLAMSLSLLTVFPVVVYHLMLFIRPALYERERHLLEVTAVMGVLLFYLGAIIGGVVIQPVVLTFVQSWLPKEVLFSPTLSSYIDFCFDLAIAFGVAFEIPMVVMLLVIFHWLSVDWLRKMRPWWVTGIFALAMVLTPPDVYSQILLAVPMWLLVELVLWVGQYFSRGD